MKHTPSQEDRDYLRSFMNYEIDPSTFHHREHLRIAYTLLAQQRVDDAYRALKAGLVGLLNSLGVGTEKYHETMTYAWLLAVKHFMETSGPGNGFETFIERNERLLDKSIMFTHYSEALMASRQAKESCVQPDLEAIPVHDARRA